jgi:PH domain
MFLNNMTQSTDDIGLQKLDVKRRELIENCKHIRSIFEAEFHPHDDVDSSSYLDMNRAGMNRNQSAAIESGCDSGMGFSYELKGICTITARNIVLGESKEEYVNMSEKRPENAYDIYDMATPLAQQDENKCPYTGLPAAHLKIMNSIQAGLLTRVEKKLFFAQSKDFYAGILEKWILLYPSKSNDMKPSECFYPKAVESDKTDNQFNILTNAGKRYHFQAPNADEFNEWMMNIKQIIEENESQESCQLRETQTSQLSFRKLPSPPLEEECHEETRDSRSSSENYYGFNRSSNQTVINNEERLYEEPCAANRKVVESCEGEKLPEQSGEKPPSLPAKTGRKTKDDSVHGYDVPKPTKASSENNEKIVENMPQPSSSSPSPSPEPPSVETPDKSRNKVSEMTAILSTINLVSPEEKRKSHTPKVRTIATPDKGEHEKGEKRVSPMKSWFSKQMNKSKKRLSKREKSPEVENENEEPLTAVKGTKVNMIINQLEKNGQLKVLSKSLKNRKSSAFNESEDYETVCVKN